MAQNIMRDTRLYIIVAGDFTKVGITKNLYSRMSNMQGGCPFDMEIHSSFYVIPDLALQIERDVHIRLRKWKVRGEWFSCDPEEAARAAIGSLRARGQSANQYVTQERYDIESKIRKALSEQPKGEINPSQAR